MSNLFQVLISMLKEEYRLHTSYSGKKAFWTFPIIIFVFAFFSALSFENIISNMPGGYITNLKQLFLGIHISVFLYGISVGAFALLGRQYIERRYGKINFIMSTPTILPVSFKKMYLCLYLRDVIFYLLLTLLPVLCGALSTIPFTNFQPFSILIFFLSALLSFLFGLSLSFFISSLYVRNVKLFFCAVATFIGILISYIIFPIVEITYIVPSVGLQYNLPPISGLSFYPTVFYLIAVCSLIILFTYLAIILATETYETKENYFGQKIAHLEKKFKFFKKWSILLAKEFIDLRRSNTFTKMVFSFIVPLFFLTATVWFINYGLNIPVKFNVIFYSAMIGFFGVLLYTWLTNLDIYDYYSTLPIRVDRVVKLKIIAFLILTLWISTIFVISVGILNIETNLLFFAIPIVIVTSIYMVSITAYLTGLRTATFLFDAVVLIKFAILSLLPNVCLAILSFGIEKGNIYAIVGLFIVCIALFTNTYFTYKGIERRWSSEEF